MSEPLVDVVIPVHRTDRDVAAAVASAQPNVQGVPTRVFVVLHNVEVDDVSLARLGASATLLRCDDRVPSPSGPRNIGFEAGSADFVFFLDSDDVLLERCLQRLWEVAVETRADVVLPSILGTSGYLGTPVVSSRSRRVLDPVDDGLFYRSHCFALIRRDRLADAGLRFPQGIRTGEDMLLMSHLYAVSRTAMALDAVYELRDGGADRITSAALSSEVRLAASEALLKGEWVRMLPAPQRRALVHRILAVNLASSWRGSPSGPDRSPVAYGRVRDAAIDFCPQALGLLSVRDLITLRFAAAPGPIERLALRKGFGLVPAHLAGVVNRNGPFLVEARKWLVRHRRRLAENSR